MDPGPRLSSFRRKDCPSLLGFSCCSSNILLQSSWDQFQSSLGCFSAAIWKRSDFRDENSGPRSVSRFDLALLIFFPSRKIEERSGVTIIPGNIVFAFAWQAFRSDFRPRLKYESGSRNVAITEALLSEISGVNGSFIGQMCKHGRAY